MKSIEGMKEKSYLCDAKLTINTLKISPMQKVEYCKELLKKLNDQTLKDSSSSLLI